MIRTFTLDDLIRYVYQETSKEESQEIEKALLFDAEIEARYKEICGIKMSITDIQEYQAKKATCNILNYSKSLNSLSNK